MSVQWEAECPYRFVTASSSSMPKIGPILIYHFAKPIKTFKERMSDSPATDVIKIEQQKLPHGVDMYKEDLDGTYEWLLDNDYLYRGYRTKLSFVEAFKR